MSKRTPNPCILHRRFADAQLNLNVSRDGPQGMLYLQGERFVAERFLLATIVKRGMRIVDVGANIGYYALLFRRLVGPSGAIIAIEPSPENLPELRLNIEDNELENAKVFEVAAGARKGNAWLLKGINSGIVDPNRGTYQIPVRSLDELLTERVDLIKIDVEGYEGFVLEGACKVIERDRPVIFLEFHPTAAAQFGHSFETLNTFLAQTYNSISYHDIAHPSSIFSKLARNYLGMDACRRLPGPPAAPMHLGRENGTFWIVCESKNSDEDQLSRSKWLNSECTH
jgi:FkbM family methyltransferase